MAPQETKFNTSFIPKKPVATPAGQSVATFKKKGPNIFSLIGLFIFFASLVATAGVYGWKYQIENDIAGQIEDLKKARNEFDEQTVANATRLNERLMSVKNILENHTAPSSVFALLEDVILKSVKLNNFTYASQADGTVKLSGSGSAAGYESIVLQSDEFGYAGQFRDVIFSNVQSSANSGVSFSFSAAVDSGLFLYSKNMDSEFSILDNDSPAIVEEGDNASEQVEFNNIFER
jgi:hypothetical protein